MDKRPEYVAWQNMKSRCYNRNATGYFNYGGRGITVCKQWRNSFEAFLNDMGLRPGDDYSLDRIDPNGHYEPLNCRWANHKDQASNKEKSVDRIYQRYTDAIVEVIGLA